MLTAQGKLGFLVLTKNVLHLSPKDQSMKLDTFLMTQLKNSWHHQERSIYCLQRYVLLFLQFKREMKIWKQIAKRFLTQLLQVESILKGLWKNEARFCMLLCDFQQDTLSVSEKRKGYEMFFLNSLLVAPNRFRPSTSSSLGVSILVI